VSWFAITDFAGAGGGSGTLGFSVGANSPAEGGSSEARTGTFTVAGRTVAVTQASTCTFEVSPPNASSVAAGSSGSVDVRAPAGCTWTTASKYAWLTINGGASGSGDGTVSYSVATNPDPASRVGSLTIAGVAFGVTQAGSPCSFSIKPTSQALSAVAASGSVAVTTATGCPWTAGSNASWITVTAGQSGTGAGTVNYSVAANGTKVERTGTVSVAGQILTVTQGK
jgi:hypothetical protein